MTAYMIIIKENSMKIDFSVFPFKEEDKLILLASNRCIEEIVVAPKNRTS
jgi:hypothetical protein